MSDSGRKQTLLAAAPGVLNLLVPGLGIVWRGPLWAGLACGLVFAACANFAIWAVLLIPDDLPAWAPPLAIGLAAGVYVGCQVQVMRSSRAHRKAQQEALRRAALNAVRQAYEIGDYSSGLAALAPISHLAAQDLLVAYRMAQLLTAAGDSRAAAAWRQVRLLDRHHIYRDEWRTATGGALHSSDRGVNLPPGDSLV